MCGDRSGQADIGIKYVTCQSVILTFSSESIVKIKILRYDILANDSYRNDCPAKRAEEVTLNIDRRIRMKKRFRFLCIALAVSLMLGIVLPGGRSYAFTEEEEVHLGEAREA